VVDDGIATGSTTKAAVLSLRRRGAAAVILAVPVGPPDTISELSKVADRVVCLSTPQPFYAIGEFYSEFEQVEDDTVRKILGLSSGTRQTSGYRQHE
jgi:putative phosphoribosyl transferase